MNFGAVRLPPGFSLHRIEAVGSTNDEARQRLNDGAAAGTIVWALEQTGGRGRDGRIWSSPRGNLYASIILRPVGTPAVVAQLGFVAALAVGATVRRFVPDPGGVAFKWPNDVLLDGRKVAGILLESEGARAEGVDGIVMGIGINVAFFPADARIPATSLVAAGADGATPALALAVLAQELDVQLQLWGREGFAPIRRQWLSRAHALGAEIVVRLPRETLEGIFSDVDAAGLLMLETATGRRSISVGDVFFAGGV